MYYLVKVKFETVTFSKKGAESVKVTTNQYLNDAMSVTEAEAKTVRYLRGEGETNFEVISSVQTKIVSVIM